MLGKRSDDPTAFVFQNTAPDIDPGSAKFADPGSSYLRIGIVGADENPCQPGFDDGIGTGPGTSMMTAWFKCDVHVGFSGTIAGFTQSKDFRMRLAGLRMKSPPNHDTIPDDDRSYCRIGACATLPPSCHLEGLTHVLFDMVLHEIMPLKEFFWLWFFAPRRTRRIKRIPEVALYHNMEWPYLLFATFGVQSSKWADVMFLSHKTLFASVVHGIAAFGQDILQFGHKLVDILELSINGCKTHIGYLIQIMEGIHDGLTDNSGFYLSFTRFLKLTLEVVDDLFDGSDGYRALFTGALDSGNDLFALERLTTSVLLDDQGQHFFDTFKGRETSFALRTFAPSPNIVPFLAES
jgi:hypothetical protein